MGVAETPAMSMALESADIVTVDGDLKRHSLDTNSSGEKRQLFSIRNQQIGECWKHLGRYQKNDGLFLICCNLTSRKLLKTHAKIPT